MTIAAIAILLVCVVALAFETADLRERVDVLEAKQYRNAGALADAVVGAVEAYLTRTENRCGD